MVSESPDNNTESKKNQGNNIDFQILMESKKKIFDSIKNNLSEFDYDDQILILANLLGHDLENGLRLMQEMDLPPKFYFDCFSDRRFLVKHSKFTDTFKKLIKNEKSNLAMSYKSAISINTPYELRQGFLDDYDKKCKNSKCKDILCEMDRIYSQYLPLLTGNNFEYDVNDPRDLGTKLGENRILEPILSVGKYYSTSVITKLYDLLCNDENKNNIEFIEKQDFVYKKLGKKDSQALQKDFISKDELESIIQYLISKKLISEKDKESILGSNVYRPLDLVFQSKLNLVENINVKELEKLIGNTYGENRSQNFSLSINDSSLYEIKNLGNEVEKREIKEICSDFYDIRQIQVVDGKVYFRGKKDKDGKWGVYENGKKIPGDFHRIYDFQVVNGKFYFYGKKDKDGKWGVYENGKEIAGDFDDIDFLQVVDGKVYFYGEKNEDGKLGVYKNGNKIAGDFYSIDAFQVVDGKVYFYGEKNEDGKWGVYENGKKIPGDFHRIYDFQVVNGKFYFYGEKNEDGKFGVYKNGKEIAGDFYSIDALQVVNGEVYFYGKKNEDGKFGVYKNGNKIAGDFYDIYRFQVVDGKVYFYKDKDGKYGVGVYENGNKIAGDFYSIDALQVVNGEVYFYGKKNENGKFGVYKNGKEIAGDFYDIYRFQVVDGKVYFYGKKDKDGKYGVYEISLGTTEDKELTEEIKNKLNFLNLCMSGKSLNRENLGEVQEKITDYMSSTKRDNENLNQKYKIKRVIETILSGMIKKDLMAFIDTISPTATSKTEDIRARRIFEKLFPKERKPFSSMLQKLKGGDNPFSYLKDYGESNLNGGSISKDAEKILEIRGNIDDIMISNVYGKYSGSKWKQSEFFVDVNIEGKVNVSTVTIPKIFYGSPILLPKPINSRIVDQRVKGIKSDGTEVDLEVSTSSTNISSVIVADKNIKKIIYSIEQPVNKYIPDLTQDEYETFKSKFINQVGNNDLIENIDGLDLDDITFLESIKDRPPREKLIEIENYVRENGFYDYNYGEIKEELDGKSIYEKINICKTRINDIKNRHPELVGGLEGKKWAGVCADFANISTLLLRRAGFLSGVISGLQPDGENVTTNNAHGVAYVVYPDKKGGNQVITIDGTPNGTSVSQQSLQEIIENPKKIEDGNNLSNIITGNSYTKKEIAELIAGTYNGDLENLVNEVLNSDSIKFKNYSHINGLLNLYQYSGIDFTSTEKEELDKFIGTELKKLELDGDYIQNANSGHMIFDLFQEYISKFDDKAKGCDDLEKILEYGKNNISNLEYGTAKMFIQYFRAEYMNGKRK